VGFAGNATTGVLGMWVDGTNFFNGWKTTALLQAGVEGVGGGACISAGLVGWLIWLNRWFILLWELQLTVVANGGGY
jgi:hypothetical protein